MSAGPTPQTREPRPCLPPHPPVRRSDRPLPPGTCDTHCHVFAPPSFHPLDPGRSYTPAIVTLADYRALMDAYGIERAVLVQPSVYGFDNGVLLAALAEMPDRLRGIAVMAPDTPDAELHEAHRLGVRGVRVNPRNPAGLPLAALPGIAARIAPLGWHVQLQVCIEDVPDLRAIVEALPLPVVIDHFGFPDLALGPRGRAFEELVALAAAGLCHVKLSGVSRIAGSPEHYKRLQPFVERLVTEAPDALLWATDWPHTECYDTVPEDDALVDLVWDWLPDEDLRRKVLCDNPDRLYWASAPERAVRDGGPCAEGADTLARAELRQA